MDLEEALADARATFPNFPDDAFVLWIDDRIRQNGWPPAGFEWQGFLDGRSIAYWQAVRWRRQRVSLSPTDLSDSAFALVRQIAEAASGRTNLISRYIPNTAERLKTCAEYVQANGTTPGILLLHRSHDGTSVLDGHHRVAALLIFQSHFPAGTPPLAVDAWIAEPPGDH